MLRPVLQCGRARLWARAELFAASAFCRGGSAHLAVGLLRGLGLDNVAVPATCTGGGASHVFDRGLFARPQRGRL